MNEEALEATTSLLTLNPELNTAWNYRRNILSGLFENPPESGQNEQEEPEKPDIFASLRTESSASQDPSNSGTGSHSSALKQRLIEDDLELTSHALRVHPKVYWIWNHRKWCLLNYPEETDEADEKKRREAKWWMEMKLVDKMLDLDPRNCESRRVHIIASQPQHLTAMVHRPLSTASNHQFMDGTTADISFPK